MNFATKSQHAARVTSGNEISQGITTLSTIFAESGPTAKANG
jgi:hypothetical protein